MGEAFESIRRGLNEVVQHARGQRAGGKACRPVAVNVAEASSEQAFKLRKATFRGQGLSPEAEKLDAAGLLELANERRGR
jgi:hypothetical protein